MSPILAQGGGSDTGTVLWLLLIIGIVVGGVYAGQAYQRQQLERISSEATARLSTLSNLPRFETFEFPNSAAGQSAKNALLANATARGWTVVSESITGGHMKGGQACCLATLCLPLAFLAGRTEGSISVTLRWEP